MVNLFRKVLVFFALIIIGCAFFACGDSTYPYPYDPEKTLGGVGAGNSEAATGFLAGGGDCGDGGPASGIYCVASAEGTTILNLKIDNSYEIRTSSALGECDSGKNYTNFGELLVRGEWERDVDGEQSYLSFKRGKDWAAFIYTADFFGLSLCSPHGDPVSVGLTAGEFIRVE
ncbi:MAG: hypothetical protein PHQ00_07260 [Phycisphaerae bacterium]|nr:hypothetical protein [Phycisphaerae bacterium]